MSTATASAPAPPQKRQLRGWWFTVSLPEPDRVNDELLPQGCKYSEWAAAGASWFFMHDKTTPPIGSSWNPNTGKLDFRIEKDKIVACCWLNEETELSRSLAELLELGHLKAATVGLIPNHKALIRKRGGGYIVPDWTLLEISLTGTPACAGCVGGVPAVAKACATAKACTCRTTAEEKQKTFADERRKIEQAHDQCQRWAAYLDDRERELAKAIVNWTDRLMTKETLESIEAVITSHENLYTASEVLKSFSVSPAWRLLDADVAERYEAQANEAAINVARYEKNFGETVPLHLSQERGGRVWCEAHRVIGLYKSASPTLSAAADAELSESDQKKLNDLIEAGMKLQEFVGTLRRRRAYPDHTPKDEATLRLLERAVALWQETVKRQRHRAARMLAGRVTSTAYQLGRHPIGIAS